MFFKDKNRNMICLFSILFLFIILYLWSNTENFATTIPMTSSTFPMTTNAFKLSKNPQTNLYQQNFDGTSNVYSPYIYHDM